MLVFVLRALTDCSNGGPSAGHDMIELTLPGQTPNTDTRLPRFWVARFMGRRIVLPGDPILGFEDKDLDTLGGWMCSGNYANTSDSRFTAFSEHPIPIFDRREDGRYLNGEDPLIRRSAKAELFNSQAYRRMADVLNQAIAVLVKRGGGPLTAYLSQAAAEVLSQVNKPRMFATMTRDVAPTPSLAQTIQAEMELLTQLIAAHQGHWDEPHFNAAYRKSEEVLARLTDTTKGKD